MILYSSCEGLWLVLYSSYEGLWLVLYSSYEGLWLVLYSSYEGLWLVLYSSYEGLWLVLYSSNEGLWLVPPNLSLLLRLFKSKFKLNENLEDSVSPYHKVDNLHIFHKCLTNLKQNPGTRDRGNHYTVKLFCSGKSDH